MLLSACLQKLTPIRGRKLIWSKYCIYTWYLFIEITPDKGTETFSRAVSPTTGRLLVFTEVNPDKGTETKLFPFFTPLIKCLQKLTPIRGRKPVIFKNLIPECRLQKLTPIRGRKLAPLPSYQLLS